MRTQTLRVFSSAKRFSLQTTMYITFETETVSLNPKVHQRRPVMTKNDTIFQKNKQALKGSVNFKTISIKGQNHEHGRKRNQI